MPPLNLTLDQALRLRCAEIAATAGGDLEVNTRSLYRFITEPQKGPAERAIDAIRALEAARVSG